jgi:hypothetical protein
LKLRLWDTSRNPLASWSAPAAACRILYAVIDALVEVIDADTLRQPNPGERVVRIEPDDFLFVICPEQEKRANHRCTIVVQLRTGDDSLDAGAGKGRFVVCVIVEPGLRLHRFRFYKWWKCRARHELASGRNDLSSDNDPEQSHKGNHGRCWRANAKQAVYRTGENASKERENIGLHRLEIPLTRASC